MKRYIFALLLLLLSAFLHATAARAQERRVGDLRFEPYTFKTGEGKEMPAELGRLVVPENRSRPGGGTVELAFVRLKSTAQKPAPPLVILAGGPGGSGIAEARVFWYALRPLLDAGDIIALEQRGTGQSRPYMMCGGIEGFEGDDLVSRDRMTRLLKERFRPCAEDWRSKGVDVTAYNTKESADDVEDLRRALGAEKVNLWGFSYGTQLGLMVIRRHPASVGRAVFAGVEGPDDTRKLPSKIQKHLEDVSRLVKQDPQWNRLIPDFPALMRSVHEQLDRTPATVEILNRKTKEKKKVRVGKFAFQVMVGIDVGDSKDLARFPALYYSISKGDYTLLAQSTQSLQDRITAPIPWAMTFPTDCASGATQSRDRRIEREAKGTLLGHAINFPWPDICEVWSSPDLGDGLRSPVRAKVPVLFISGTLDGRTPVTNSRELRKGFPTSALIVVENSGHEDVYNPPAVVQAVTDFVNGKPVKDATFTHPPLKFLPPGGQP